MQDSTQRLEAGLQRHGDLLLLFKAFRGDHITQMLFASRWSYLSAALNFLAGFGLLVGGLGLLQYCAMGMALHHGHLRRPGHPLARAVRGPHRIGQRTCESSGGVGHAWPGVLRCSGGRRRRACVVLSAGPDRRADAGKCPAAFPAVAGACAERVPVAETAAGNSSADSTPRSSAVRSPNLLFPVILAAVALVLVTLGIYVVSACLFA